MSASRRNVRASSSRAGAVVLAIAVFGLLSAPTQADTKSALASAKERLRQLTAEIAAQQRRVSAVHEDLILVAEQLEDRGHRYTRVLVDMVQAQQALEAAREDYDEARGALNSRVRAMYMQGVPPAVGVVLASGSLSDLTYGFEFQDRLAREDSVLVERAHSAARTQAREETRTAAILDRQRTLLRELDLEREALSDAVARHQAALSSLASLRAEAVALVRSLEGRLRREEVAAARISLDGVDNYDEWGRALLQRLGAPGCTANVVVVVAWQTAEGTSARFNPLATTLDMPGATTFNSHGVKNYVSLEQGVRATILTLQRGLTAYGYGAIIEALRDCADPMVTAHAINQSKWCYGCAGGRYVLAIVPAIAKSYGLRI